ncbi:MAG: PHP domain-containing protein [Bacilli bacterium]|nr:PHP domain-containing protein [Bacilli bacterium]
MEIYRYETHCHTFEGSACATSKATELVHKYKELGFQGIIITDHFYNGNCRPLRSLDWNKWVDEYASGYLHAYEEGQRIGLDVFFGIEWCRHGFELLTYGLSIEWLKQHPEIIDMDIVDYCRLVKRAGALVIQAHPFREASYIDRFTLIPHEVDGLEVINTSHKDPKYNERAKWLADSFNLVGTSGSDTHSINNINYGGVGFKEKLTSINDYVRLVKNRQIVKLFDCE